MDTPLPIEENTMPENNQEWERRHMDMLRQEQTLAAIKSLADSVSEMAKQTMSLTEKVAACPLKSEEGMVRVPEKMVEQLIAVDADSLRLPKRAFYAIIGVMLLLFGGEKIVAHLWPAPVQVVQRAEVPK